MNLSSSTLFQPAQTIARKRDGHELPPEEIEAFMTGFVRGSIPSYQMSALAMAILLRGMTARETVQLTQTMLHSGRLLQWPDGRPPKVDKHSTGGVGDKISLVLAPALACCGLQVPMISGRGLGATGGTLDKLDSIPGFRTDLSLQQLCSITESVGCVITGTTEEIAPADRDLYALRDVTATVPSIPLITASIMSKKLAENLSSLVLDVKFGSGAFMKSMEDALALAKSLVDVGQQMGVKTSALLTDMNQPLGNNVGNALEVDETVAVLKGGGPADVVQLTVELGAKLLVLENMAADMSAARDVMRRQLASGNALEKFREMVTAQGGDLDAPRHVATASQYVATRHGVIARMDAEALGLAVIALGGGRTKLTDTIDHAVGLEMLVRIGDTVRNGQPLIRVFAEPAKAESIRGLLDSAIMIGDDPVDPPELIVDRIN